MADEYDRRYVENEYFGIDQVLAEFAVPEQRVLEVGCGTGHWVARLRAHGCEAVGLDPSEGMLRRAQVRMGAGAVVQGRAEHLPFETGSMDRVAVVNAMHHFTDPPALVREARRVLRRRGRIVVMGLDPSQNDDRWFVYDYFPRTLEIDKGRYPSVHRIGGWFRDAGFSSCVSRVAHHITMQKSAREYLESGTQMRSFTSQLLLLTDHEFDVGIDDIRRAERDAVARGDQLDLRADLKIYATFGDVEG